MNHTRVYRDGKLVEEDFDPARISDFLEEPDTVVWLDIPSASAEGLALVAEEFALHPLAVEDAVNAKQRAKVDHYADHSFLTVYAVLFDEPTSTLSACELAVFASPRYLVTVHKTDGFSMDPVMKLWDDNPDRAGSGVSFLLHGLLDVVVDGYFVAVEHLDEGITGLEDLLFGEKPMGRQVQRESFELRKSLVQLRRVVLPMREVVNTLLRREVGLVDEAMGPYFQDVYDHVLRATEWTESLRDLVTTVLETNLTIQGNNLNEIMKKLTSWAAIIAVPTAVTGFYGQNVPYPGFGQHFGFWVSTAAMILISVGLYVAFRARNWL